jgi:hypothetical protein
MSWSVSGGMLVARMQEAGLQCECYNWIRLGKPGLVGAQGDIFARCCAWISRPVPPYCGVLVLSPQSQALVNRGQAQSHATEPGTAVDITVWPTTVSATPNGCCTVGHPRQGAKHT